MGEDLVSIGHHSVLVPGPGSLAGEPAKGSCRCGTGGSQYRCPDVAADRPDLRYCRPVELSTGRIPQGDGACSAGRCGSGVEEISVHAVSAAVKRRIKCVMLH